LGTILGMDAAERLHFLLGPKLEAKGATLDRLDYGRLRALGVQLRDIPNPREDWDLPPSSLQGWVASYEASKNAISVAAEHGLMDILKENSDEIQTALSLDLLPQIDTAIADPETLGKLIAQARVSPKIKNFDAESFSKMAPSEREVAEHIRVELHVSIPWAERPKVDKGTGSRRLKIGALIGKAALGSALAVTNLCLGAFGAITSLPTAANAPTMIPLITGLITSAYTGFSASMDAFDKLSDEIKK